MKSVCKYCPRSAMCLVNGEDRWRSVARLSSQPRSVRCCSARDFKSLRWLVYKFEIPEGSLEETIDL